MDAATVGAEGGPDKEAGMNIKIDFTQMMLGYVVSATLGMAVIAVAAFIFGILVMLLWNWLIPVFIPTLPIAQHITYWQGWGLCTLLAMLSGSGRAIKKTT